MKTRVQSLRQTDSSVSLSFFRTLNNGHTAPRASPPP